jgi:hypothetical protein
MIKSPIEDLLSIISQGRPLRREIVHVSLAKHLDSFFTCFENSDSICPQVFRSYTSPYDSKKNINITTKQQMASGSKLMMQMNKKIIFKKKKKAPSIKIPKRRASVPVVANLSFLASNSAIVNAFIAFHDHLYFHSHHQKENIRFTLIPANPLTKIYSIINS